VIVMHVAITTVEDYVARREPHRRTHIERLTGLRAAGIVVGGGPAPDGRSVDLVYRLPQAAQLQTIVEEDPYWTGGAWTGYAPRSFAAFVEPWAQLPLVLDGSRRATIVEGRVVEPDMAQFALIELRGAGRLAFGGFFPDHETFALATSGDADTALGWFKETGFWAPESLRARPLLHVL
jgi:uncharacterized protein YciI